MIFFYGYFGSGGRSIGLTNNVSHETLWPSMMAVAGELGVTSSLRMIDGVTFVGIVTDQGFF